jgi:hypothetical protein
MQLSAGRSGSLIAAALALPGLAATLPRAARAEAPPTHGEVSLRYSYYEDFQPGASRMRVELPSLFVLLPIGDDWALEGQYTVDAVSGASPLFHDTLSGASGLGISDVRRSLDLEATRYFERMSVALGAVVSDENDYDSLAVRAQASFDSADRNTSWNIGVGHSDDEIDSVNDVAENEPRRVTDLLLGWTRVLSPNDLLQVSASHAHGRGYFDDPYKPLEARPDERDQRALALRYNHFVGRYDAALRLSYRFHADDWDIDAHAVEAAWEQPLGRGWSWTPSLRYYTQSAASFYVDPPFGQGFVPGEPYSGDTRLSAFGALSAAVKLGAPLTAHWRADVKFQFYRQRGDWRLFGDGSPGLEPLSARVFEVGVTYEFD